VVTPWEVVTLWEWAVRKVILDMVLVAVMNVVVLLAALGHTAWLVVELVAVWAHTAWGEVVLVAAGATSSSPTLLRPKEVAHQHMDWLECWWSWMEALVEVEVEGWVELLVEALVELVVEVEG